jgi:hypothetical protein
MHQDLDPAPARPTILAWNLECVKPSQPGVRSFAPGEPYRCANCSTGLLNCGLSLMAPAWETMEFSIENLPWVVPELRSPAALVHHDGGRDKGRRIRMLALGYCQRCAFVSNTDEGGAMSPDRLVTSWLVYEVSRRVTQRFTIRAPRPLVLLDRRWQNG